MVNNNQNIFNLIPFLLSQNTTWNDDSGVEWQAITQQIVDLILSSLKYTKNVAWLPKYHAWLLIEMFC